MRVDPSSADFPYICNHPRAHIRIQNENDVDRWMAMASSVPAPFMDDGDAKVIVSTYEELPRRRRPIVSRVASSSSMAAARAKASAPPRQAAGSYSRRALLLAYAQQLRRRRRGPQPGQQSGAAPLLLEWTKWKAGHPVAAAAGGDGGAMRRIGRNWCSRLRCCVRLWVRTFLRRVKRIRENVSCKKGDILGVC